jgi:hypothetical protein
MKMILDLTSCKSAPMLEERMLEALDPRTWAYRFRTWRTNPTICQASTVHPSQRSSSLRRRAVLTCVIFMFYVLARGKMAKNSVNLILRDA